MADPLFEDVGKFKLNANGRTVMRDIENYMSKYFEKYNQAEVTHVALEAMSLSAGMARLNAERRERDAAEPARLVPPPVAWNAAPNAQQWGVFDINAAQDQLFFAAAGAPVAGVPAVGAAPVDDAEDVEF